MLHRQMNKDSLCWKYKPLPKNTDLKQGYESMEKWNANFSCV